LPTSIEYTNIRNEAYKKLLKETKEKSLAQDNVMEANTDSIQFFFIGVPESFESFEVYNILRYFDIDFELIEDNPYRPFYKQRWGFKKEEEYPFFIIESNSRIIPTGEGVGKD